MVDLRASKATSGQNSYFHVIGVLSGFPGFPGVVALRYSLQGNGNNEEASVAVSVRRTCMALAALASLATWAAP